MRRAMAKALRASPVAASGLAAVLARESAEDRQAREEVQVCMPVSGVLHT